MIKLFCKPATRIIPTLLFLLLLFTTAVSLAASYDASDYESLLNEANSKGFVRVMITLDDTVTLEDMANNKASLNAAMKNKAQNVLAELGQNALKSGYWNNGIGQMGAYVNEIGLRILAGSNNAISFTRDVTHAYRIKTVDDGSFEAIESAINADGSANVDIFLNADTADYELDNLGNTVFKPSPAMSEQARRILASISTKHFAQGINVIELDENRPVVRASIDRNAFYALIESEDVRAVRPVGYKDPRKAQWPEEVLDAAKEHGDAEIMITLRGGDFASAKTGYMSSTALRAQVNANQRAFDDIFSRIGVSIPARETLAGLEVGVLQIKLPFEALVKLYDDADPRILSVEMNKPAAQIALANLVEVDIKNEIQLSSPGELCFPQTSFHAEPIVGSGYRLDSVMLNHYLILPEEDHFKKGAVFVGFRLKSQPEKLWLFGRFEWKLMSNDIDLPLSFPRVKDPSMPIDNAIDVLQPINHTFFSDFPINVSAYADEGELLVGYGLATDESATVRNVFMEMLQENRFKVLWEIGNNLPSTQGETVCLDIQGVRVGTVFIPGPNVIGPDPVSQLFNNSR